MTSEQPTSPEIKLLDGGHDDLASARRVLKLEAEALEMLAQSLGDELVAAVDLLYGATGRVIVSGMGKSGHIGRKIAATMASTGTPASYVHPGEASHGDLGMITSDDAVLALSNSGNTPELGDIVAYTRRYRIPLIAIVGRDNSTLGNAADVALVLPPAPEACPMGLAPTTSTTLTLALGDALSVALLERKGFSPDQFQVLHPGGQLGKSLVKVEDIMQFFGVRQHFSVSPATPRLALHGHFHQGQLVWHICGDLAQQSTNRRLKNLRIFLWRHI